MEFKLTNPVDVVLALVGVVVVNDKLNVIHVQTTAGDISGHEDAGRAVLELTKYPVSLLLLLVTVDAHGGPTMFPH